MGVKILDDQVTEDGLYLDRFRLEDGKIWRHRLQMNRLDILRENVARRGYERRKPDGLVHALTIPEDDLAILVARYPELGSKDREIKHKAWRRFMLSPESEPYRTYNAKRGMTA